MIDFINVGEAFSQGIWSYYMASLTYWIVTNVLGFIAVVGTISTILFLIGYGVVKSEEEKNKK